MEIAGAVVLVLCTFLKAQPSVSADAALDFCVGDLEVPPSPSGFACKDGSRVTSDDFAYTGLRRAGNTSNTNGAAVTPAFATQFPGLNGLGVSIARFDIAPGGTVPLHSHPGASKLLLVVRGSVLAGFISSTDNVPYSKLLHKGDIMVFPSGLLHYLHNSGKDAVLAYASFSSSTPATQLTSYALFGNDLPVDVVEKSTFISESEVRRLKAILGGK